MAREEKGDSSQAPDLSTIEVKDLAAVQKQMGMIDCFIPFADKLCSCSSS